MSTSEIKKFTLLVLSEIIYMEKKLLDSDWLRAVQFKCNTNAKSVLPVQKVYYQCKKHIVILNYNRLKENVNLPRLMISRNMR